MTKTNFADVCKTIITSFNYNKNMPFPQYHENHSTTFRVILLRYGHQAAAVLTVKGCIAAATY